MANNKKTKKDMYLQIKKNYALTQEEIKFIDHELELLEKKNSKEKKKPTATQTANVDYKTAILSFLKENKDKRYTVTELIKSVDEIADLSNQRVSALVKQLRDDFLVERVEEKRKAYFFYVQQFEDLEEELEEETEEELPEESVENELPEEEMEEEPEEEVVEE